MEPEALIPKHGGYRKLKSFQVAQLVYDVTVRFCDRYIDPRSRTHDQMVQAARSGVQNIAEGSQASGTSKKMEMKLTNVARQPRRAEAGLRGFPPSARAAGLGAKRPAARRADRAPAGQRRGCGCVGSGSARQQWTKWTGWTLRTVHRVHAVYRSHLPRDRSECRADPDCRGSCSIGSPARRPSRRL